ncbi:MAG TPA: OmpA family protein [Tepidisphaeraceae bacterium]
MAPLLLTAVAGLGCQNKVLDENKQLRDQNVELQDQLHQKDTDLSSRPQASDLAALQATMREKDQQIADLQSQMNKPVAGETAANDGSLAGITVTRDTRAGTITVNVPGDVLFASGDAAIKPGAKATLSKIADILKKQFGGKKLMVDGFTDTDPITRTRDKWKDNLDLSAARARSVATELASDGIPKSQIGVRAFGDTAPRGGKTQSRRVEIVVVTR